MSGLRTGVAASLLGVAAGAFTVTECPLGLAVDVAIQDGATPGTAEFVVADFADGRYVCDFVNGGGAAADCGVSTPFSKVDSTGTTVATITLESNGGGDFWILRVAAAEEAALAAKNDMIVSGSGTSSSTPGVGVAGAATPATGAASAAPADETTAAAAAAATTAAVSAAADTGTSSMDASTLAAVGAAAAVTAAEEVAAVEEEEDTSSSYEATVIDSSTSSESTPMFGTAIDGHLDPAFRADNIYQDGSTMSSYDSNMASQYHGSSPYGGVPVHHHYHPPQHIHHPYQHGHHPYQHGHHPYSYSHQPMDKSVVIKHELSDEADKKITKTMNFMEYILKNSQKP